MALTAFIPMLIEWLLVGVGDSFVAAWSALSQQAAAIAVTTVWQGAVIACGLAICLRLAPRTTAAHRFAIWAAAFVALVSLPFVKLAANIPVGAASGASYAGLGSAAGPLLSIDARWGLLIAALWAVATAYRAVDLAIHAFRLRMLWRDAVPVDVEGSLKELLAVSRPASRRGAVEVCTTTTLQRPSVIGFLEPRILIPDWLFARLTAGELEQIVLHEAEHLRRHDDWTNLLQKLGLVLFPLNPALVWIERRLCREREMACDESVIEITHAPRAYAACLASLAERGLERRAEALSLGAWQRRPELVHRVHSILRRKRTLGVAGTRALLGALGCSLLFGSIELARCPQLVAFVSVRNPLREHGGAGLNARANLRRGSAKLLNVSCTGPRSSGASRGQSGVRAMRGDGVGSAAGLTQSDNRPSSVQRAGMGQAVEVVSRTASYQAAAPAPRAVMLMAELPKVQAAPAEPQQQWLVVTTWEQVETSAQRSGVAADGLIGDYETGTPADGPAGSNVADRAATGGVHSKAQPTNQITVTRLILTIYPAASLSTQPTFVPTRDGWFVLQL